MHADIKNDQVEITFFVPCYNEENNILKTITTILEAIKETTISSFEILVIDDCSKDKTVQIIEDYVKQNPYVPIRLKKNEINRGLGYNYVEGAFVGKGKYYIAIFGDNSEPKETIVTILKEMGKANIVIPYFGDQDNRTQARRIISKTFVCLVNILSGCHLRYYNGPVLHLRYNVMRWHSNTLGFAYQAELITQLLVHGESYREVQISNLDREGGLSKAFTIKNGLSVTHSLFQIFCKRLRRILFRV